jgi:cobalt/nickel transport system permease protein
LLVAVLLGPWAALLVMTSVIAVQALLFQDGGLLAMGFNIFNMGVVTVFVGYALYTQISRRLGNTSRGQVIGAAVGAWLGVEVAAIATALQLTVSGTSPLDVALPAMVGVHALIGIGEALITVAALAFVRQTRPDLLVGRSAYPAQRSGWIAVGLVIALLVVLISPLASSSPDGLERVAEDKGFVEEVEDSPYEVLPDYTVPFIEDETATTIIAGAIGVLIVAGVGYGTGRLGRRKIAAETGDTTSYSS